MNNTLNHNPVKTNCRRRKSKEVNFFSKIASSRLMNNVYFANTTRAKKILYIINYKKLGKEV